MSVMLGGRELVFRRKRAVDRPQIEGAPIGRRLPSDVVGNVGERHKSLALREQREGPFRYAKDAQARHRQPTLEDLSTCAPSRHVPFFLFTWFRPTDC